MVIHDIAFVGADTVRTRAYLQLLFRKKYALHHYYILTNTPEAMEAEASAYQPEEGFSEYFSKDEPVLYTLHQANASYTLIQTDSINSAPAIEMISKAAETNLIYSGFSGQIIKKEAFDSGKTFIHVHAGILPAYRGSTTVYYSLLQEGTIGATAIFLNEGIDEGSIITKETFPMPEEKVDFDYIFDPHIRASVLLKVINLYLENGALESEMQKASLSETYYIIHPVLKHLAILKAERGVKERMKML